MSKRNDWCPNQDCTPLTTLLGEEGSCIGKLPKATDHGELKGINDKRWCIRSEGTISNIMLNNEDMEFFIYQMGCAAKADGQSLKFWALKTLEHQDYCR